MSTAGLELFRARRTVRKFTPEPVSPEQIDTLLEAAMYAPSRLNRQPWHFLIVRDWVVKAQIAEQLRVHPYIEEAPALVLVCARPSSSPTWLMDVAAATENLLLAATSMGLGGAWVGAPDTVLWDELEKLLRARLHTPDDVRIAALVAIGHAAQTPAPYERSDRFDPLKVHWGLWEHVGLREREPGT